MNLQDAVRLPPDEELLDDARQLAVEREFSRIRGMSAANLLAMTEGATRQTLEDILWDLAEEWVEADRAAGFDCL
jgi:hypothetical protein